MEGHDHDRYDSEVIGTGRRSCDGVGVVPSRIDGRIRFPKGGAPACSRYLLDPLFRSTNGRSTGASDEQSVMATSLPAKGGVLMMTETTADHQDKVRSR